MHTLTFPVFLLRRYMHDMLRRPAGPVGCPVGISRRTGHCEFLAAMPGSTVERVMLLSRLGVQHLALIDPDRVEPPNVGEMFGISATDHGRLKVEAFAATLATRAPTCTDIVAIPTSITRQRALQALQECDVLVSCVDHDSARLAATALATLFCKPVLDIATGVHGHGPMRQVGADVRFMLPGRC